MTVVRDVLSRILSFVTGPAKAECVGHHWHAVAGVSTAGWDCCRCNGRTAVKDRPVSVGECALAPIADDIGGWIGLINPERPTFPHLFTDVDTVGGRQLERAVQAVRKQVDKAAAVVDAA